MKIKEFTFYAGSTQSKTTNQYYGLLKVKQYNGETFYHLAEDEKYPLGIDSVMMDLIANDCHSKFYKSLSKNRPLINYKMKEVFHTERWGEFKIDFQSGLFNVFSNYHHQVLAYILNNLKEKCYEQLCFER